MELAALGHMRTHSNIRRDCVGRSSAPLKVERSSWIAAADRRLFATTPGLLPEERFAGECVSKSWPRRWLSVARADQEQIMRDALAAHRRAICGDQEPSLHP